MVGKALLKMFQFQTHLQASVKNLENIASFSTIISNKNIINTRTF
jgi:hypothetical protein